MTTRLTLEEVAHWVKEEDQPKWDTKLFPAQVSMESGRLVFESVPQAVSNGSLALTAWATSQLCERLKLPVAYFRRCPESLQDEQVNYWLRHLPSPPRTSTGQGREGNRHENERWLFRMKGSAVRGILSDRYSPLDNAALMEAISEAIGKRFEVGWMALTEESFHLRLIDPQMAREARAGDRLLAGIHLANSEVGKRAITVDAMVYRLVCANGLVRLVRGKSLFYRRHVSLRPQSLAAALQKALSEALVSSAGLIERLLWAREEGLPDMDAAIEQLTRQWSLSEEMTALMRRSLLREAPSQQETLYGLVNAVTEAAQSLSPDERYTLEALAGDLLEKGLKAQREPLRSRSLRHPASYVQEAASEPLILAA